MSKLRVGDILIEGSNVNIVNSYHPPGHLQRRKSCDKSSLPVKSWQQNTTPVPFSDKIAKLPYTEKTLLTTGSGLLVGFASLLHFFPQTLSLHLLAMPLLTAGCAALVMGGFKWRHNMLQKIKGHEREWKAISALLENNNDEKIKTTKWLATKAHLAEPLVVSHLHAMLQQELISEDLCEESGEWYYSLKKTDESDPPDSHNNHLPLADRIGKF
jgi:hypothetical protein